MVDLTLKEHKFKRYWDARQNGWKPHSWDYGFGLRSKTKSKEENGYTWDYELIGYDKMCEGDYIDNMHAHGLVYTVSGIRGEKPIDDCESFEEFYKIYGDKLVITEDQAHIPTMIIMICMFISFTWIIVQAITQI